MAGFGGNKGIMKDSVMPPFRIMFQSASVPSSASLDLYMAELDAQLEENNKDIDICMQSILSFTRDVPGGQSISDPKEGLLHMINNKVLEKESCYDPEVDDSVAILNGLLSMIEENPGSEERVLQEILSLSAAEGLVFPLESSAASTAQMSMASLHTIEDSTDQQIEEKWNKITQRLKKHFIEKLLRLPHQQSNLPGIPVNQRLRLLQCLAAIASDEEVWKCYQNLRTQQLEKMFRDLFPESDAVDYQSFSSHCDLIASHIINMIDEDFVVLNTGVFRKVVSVFKAIHDLYLEKYSDEMSLLVEEVSDNIFKIRHNSFASGNQSKNQQGKLQKGQSLDSMMPGGARSIVGNVQPQGEAIVNSGCIQSLQHIIKSLLSIEDHINTLLRNTTWDVVGVSTKKAKKRGSLRGVLKTSSSPEQRRHSLRIAELNNSETQIDTGSSNNSAVPTPKVIERTKTEERLHWDWKLMFKKISGDITQAVEASINTTMKSFLHEEWEQWQTYHTLTQVEVKSTLRGGKHDYPKVITKSVREFFNTCDNLLVFARAGCDGSLSAVRAAYIDTITTCLKLYHDHLIKLCVDVPIKANVKQLYLILSNAVYCRNQLTHCENVLCTDDAGKKVFVGLLKQLSDLVETISKQVLDVHNQLLATTVLHDADCHRWTDSKEFYEDERCSYTIQMWNYHIRGLKHDLWTICPPKLAQNILGSILHESLQMLTQRYVRVKPSYRRVKQFRYDLTTVLLCTAEFLFQVCKSMSQYLDPGHCDIPHYNIHNLCSTLLATLAVITSPIDQVYRIFKRGYSKRRDSQPDTLPGSLSYSGSNTLWLHWLQSSLFLPSQKHYDDMQTTNAVYLQTKLLLNQPLCEPSILLQALIMKDYTLPIMLLTRVASLEIETPTSDKKHETDSREIFTAVITVLSQCTHFTDGVAKVLMPVIDRCEDWDVLNAKKLSTLECEPPIWMLALFDLLSPYIDSVLEPLMIYILNLPSLVTGKGCLIPEIQELPCGCPPNKFDNDSTSAKKGERYIIDSALKIVVTELSEKIHVLNTAVCVTFNILQEACRHNNLKTPHNCAGLIIIGRCIREKLLSAKYTETMVGQEVPEETHKLLTVLADCIYSILIFGRAKSSISTPKMASQFVKANKEWLTSKIQLIAVHLSNELFTVPDTDILEGSTSQFADHIFTATAAAILNDINGFHHLDIILNLIKRNWLWIEEQLDMKLSLKDKSAAKTTKFDLNLTPVKEKKFIPHTEFSQLGDTGFQQEMMMNFDFNWTAMLQSDLGLSEHGFSSLLYNRHEMQDGAYLEEAEKRPVEILRSLFERDLSEMS